MNVIISFNEPNLTLFSKNDSKNMIDADILPLPAAVIPAAQYKL
jgi:hypothetical protein